MKNGLYHREVYWLAEFDSFFDDHIIERLDFTQHVYENNRKAKNRIYCIDDITLDFIKTGTIFEVEAKKEKIQKIVIRKKYKNKQDICMAFFVDDKILRCKTCWLNEQDDIHITLDIDKYVKNVNSLKAQERFSVSILELANKSKKK